MAGIQHRPVGIFWDIENCSVPKKKSPSDVIAHIRNFFVFNRLNHREYEFIISCDVTRLRKDMPEDINKAGGVTLAHVNGNSKNAADEKLRENMKKFVDTHASSVSPVLILISGDIDFVNDLRGYQTRLGCTIVLIHAEKCSSQLKVGWNEIYCFKSFCSAVKDSPAFDTAAANVKFPSKKLPDNRNQGERLNQQNQGGYGGQANPKNQGGPPEVRSKQNGQKPNRQAQTANKTEMTQQTAQLNQKRRVQNPTNHVQMFPNPSTVPPQQCGPQFGQGNKNKPFNNGPNANNFNQHIHQQTRNDRGDNPKAADAPANNKFILMVGGLPGKMDFKILKDNLQFQADKVHGKVKYVKNGQAFITFKNKSNADRAVELFNGKRVFGKTLNVSFTKSIPFEDQGNGKPKSGSDRLVMVENHGATGGSYKSKHNDGKNGSTVSNGDPVLAGIGSFIGGIVANRLAAAGNKSPDSCPIQ